MGVLVTGGTGLIGAPLVRLLVERGEKEIAVFDRDTARKTLMGVADRVTLIRGDLGILSHVVEAVSSCRPKIIFHLGAMLTAPSNDDPVSAFQANVAGTFHVLETARHLCGFKHKPASTMEDR